ncbi:MAG: flagellar biosynthesis protein FlhF, partial [Bdellovibrionales bacterium]|nr:flagellar biosynthesis protein FlhF [Bdellovibrionales bacterium]
MQVKKFEARSMKEALELVKTQLGPDAIILSAKDNSKKYGLVGESSFEITAAVSDETLHQKRFVESKLREQDRTRFNASSARAQKEIINKFVQKHVSNNQIKPITAQRYIDIDEEKNLAQERIRNAAQRAFDAYDIEEEAKISKRTWFGRSTTEKPVQKVKAQQSQSQLGKNHSSEDIQTLKREIASLKEMLSKMAPSTEIQSNPSVNYPGSQYGVHFDLLQNYQDLLKEGVNEDIAVEMILDIQNQLPLTKLKNKSLVEGLLAKKILETIIISDTKDKKFHFFVG